MKRRQNDSKKRPRIAADVPVIRTLDEIVAEQPAQTRMREVPKDPRRPIASGTRTKSPTTGPAAPHKRSTRTFGPSSAGLASRVERGNYSEPPPRSEEVIDRPQRRPTLESHETELVFVEPDQIESAQLESGGDHESIGEAKRDDFLRKELRTAIDAIENVQHALAQEAADEETDGSDTIAKLEYDLDQANEALEHAKAKQNALEQLLSEKQQDAEELSKALEEMQAQHAAALDEAEAEWRTREQELLDRLEEEDLPLAGSAQRQARKSKKSKQVDTASTRRAANSSRRQPPAKKARKKSQAR